MNYHILEADKYGNSFRVVFHIPIPDQLNSANYSYRTALVEHLGGAANITSDVASGTELTQMQAGELFEVTVSFHSHPGETEAQKQARLDQMFADLTTEHQDILQNRLSYWGYERNVP